MKIKITNHIIWALILATSLTVGHAQAQEEPAKAIEKTIREYFVSMAKRDMEGLQAVTETRLVVIEAGDKKAQIHSVATSSEKEMLPPKGNDDWEQMVVASVKVEISPTHPSIATVSFTLSAPLDDKAIAMHRDLLNIKPPIPELTQEQRKELEKRIAERAINSSMFAMLALREGTWKIVCMSFPK